MRLDTSNHDRDAAGMTYVYPVVSRRAGGVSIGINLNPNSACNWRCVYCQVPGLSFGRAPHVELEVLERELETMLTQALDAHWMETHVPEGARQLNDIALSGNGEPTSSRQFGEVLRTIERVLVRKAQLGRLKVVLITNGSLVHQPHVRDELSHLARIGGEVWFKLDAVAESTRRRLNGVTVPFQRAAQNLAACARVCPTWVQTMVLDFDGTTMDADAEREYVRELERVRASGAKLRGIHLYGFARVSHQPEAPRLKAVPRAELEALAERLRNATGLEVRVSV